MRGFICFFVIASCLLPGVCARAARPAEPGTVVYSSPANVGPLNPHLYSPNQMFAQEMVYEPLVDVAEDGTVRPSLAERWSITPDGLEYTFHLREGVRFSDGEPLTAQAVERNFAAIMANAKRHTWLPLTGMIASFKADDPYTFVLRLKAPYYPTLADLALPRPFRFISPAAFADDGSTHQGVKAPVGTGPWRLAVSSLGEYDLFERNPFYHGAKPEAEKVLIRVIPDPLSRAVALETGEIDLIYGIGQISYDTFAALRRQPDYGTAVSRPMGGMALAINSGRFPTDDVRVRQALQHATDKPTLVNGVFLGAQVQAETLFAEDVPYCDVGLVPYAFDPARAAALLDEAGWHMPQSGRVRVKDGRSLVVDMHFVGNDAAQRAIAEVLQAQYAVVGLGLNLVPEEEDAFYQRQREGEFGLIVNSTWGPPFEPHAMVGSMRQPSHADYQAQRGLPMKAEIDAMITRVLAAQDEGERRDLYNRILHVLHEQAVYLPVFYYSVLEAHRLDRLTHVPFAPGKSKILFEHFGLRRP